MDKKFVLKARTLFYSVFLEPLKPFVFFQSSNLYLNAKPCFYGMWFVKICGIIIIAHKFFQSLDFLKQTPDISKPS